MLCVQVNRLLERTLRESHCLDTESLCITAGLKVWSIRVDVHVLNHDGNIIDASGIAAIAAMAHFRRPDVTICGEEVTIHTLEDRDPIPLSVHHMPICVSFAFFDQGQFLLIDPTDKEEHVMTGRMVIAMNKHHEMCMMQMSGRMSVVRDQVKRCSDIAVIKASEITELIQQALLNDTQSRLAGEKCGCAISEGYETGPASKVKAPVTKTCKTEDIHVAKRKADDVVISSGDSDMDDDVQVKSPTLIEQGLASMGEGKVNTWNYDSDMSKELDDENDVICITASESEVKIPKSIVLSGDSEEEEVMIIGTDSNNTLTKADIQPRAQKQNAVIDLTLALKKKKRKKKNRDAK